MSREGRTPTAGGELGHYRLIRQLGRGGMGEVYLAEDRRLGREVALKVLASEIEGDRERLQRFQREAKVVAALNHPNVVTIYSVEEEEGYHFLTMEYVEGSSLRELVTPRGLPVERVLEIGRELAAALAVAHGRGILHRDLKPENVMLSDSGRVKVLDFGLAKAAVGATTVGDPTAEQLTGRGCVVGTVPYMSPEQLRGAAVDERSDLFSLGVVLYELAAGVRPFGGGSGADVVASILGKHPVSLAEVRPDLPVELVELVERCLSKAVAHRPPDAAGVEETLATLAKDLEVERVISSGGRRRRLSSSSGQAMAVAQNRRGPLILLAALFVVNWLETSAESLIPAESWLASFGDDIVRAIHWLEGGRAWVGADIAGPVQVYGYASAYFFAFPAMVLVCLLLLVSAPSAVPLRVFTAAAAIDYAVSLPFFVFFPVAERWSVPESGAILVSDLWSSSLIEFLRPISGLDNCFPSFHTSLTVIVVLMWVWYVRRAEVAVGAVGAIVVLSTVALGIHWVADVVAGLAVGVASAVLARRLVHRAPPTPNPPEDTP